MLKEAKRMIGIAKSEKNPYDFVWVIFDKDGHAKIPEAFELRIIVSQDIYPPIFTNIGRGVLK